jgi:lipopolysaccharide/colanic/teichoic acid biosynthesis glycosyltransferase
MKSAPFKSFHHAIDEQIAASFSDCALDASSGGASGWAAALSRALGRTVKRLTDVVFALVFLAISFPVLLVIAVLIKTTSRGPVFFRQERVGYRGRKFRIWKFRTMRADGGEKEHKAYVEALLRQDERDGGEDKVERYVDYLNRRITPVGHFLRASSLDELPQLFNILSGDMSLVGPRPHPTYEVESYKKWYHRRQHVKPGLTGWSKLNLRFTPENYEEAILFDLWYVDHWSLLLDLKILTMTVPFVLSMKDAT